VDRPGRGGPCGEFQEDREHEGRAGHGGEDGDESARGRRVGVEGCERGYADPAGGVRRGDAGYGNEPGRGGGWVLREDGLDSSRR
jgi:hypothetical protein